MFDMEEFIAICGYFDLEKALELWLNHSTYTGVLHFKNLIYLGFNKKNKLLVEWVSNPVTIKVFTDRIEEIILSESHEVSEADLEELNLFYEVLMM